MVLNIEKFKLMISNLKNIFNNLWDHIKFFFVYLKKNLISIATLGMMVTTFFLALETQNMSVETKKLVDLSIEQFKIKSYPSFLLEISNGKYLSENLYQEFKILNRGDITAHNVSFLAIVFCNKNSKKYTTIMPRLFFEKDYDKGLNATDFDSKSLLTVLKQLVLILFHQKDILLTK